MRERVRSCSSQRGAIDSPLASASRKSSNAKCPYHLCYHCHHCSTVEVSIPTPQWTCIAVDKHLSILENTKYQSKKTVEDKTEVMANCSAIQPAPSFSSPGWAMAETLPLAAQAVQVPASTTDKVAADLTAQQTLDIYGI